MKRNVSLGVKLAALAFLISLATSWLITGPLQAPASQGAASLPTTGIYNGLTAANNINAGLDALLTCNSGASAPTNALSGAPEEGQCWLDTTSSTLKIKKIYTGSAWVVDEVLDVTNGIAVKPIGGGTATVASSGTTDLCASPQAVQTVSGTTTITGFGSNCVVGIQKTLIFSGITTLTYNATSLIIPGAANKTTANGDIALAIYLGSGNWRVLDYVPITGVNVQSIAGNTGVFTLGEGVTNLTNVIKANALYFRGYLSGLTLSAAGSTGTFGVAVGTAADGAATPAGLMVLTSAFTKTTASWTVGTGNGGLDTGAIAPSTWYHVFLMKRPDTGVVDVCESVTVTACTTGGSIPAAYTIFRRIGSMKTDGSSQWIKFTQTANNFIWSVSVADVSNIATTASRVSKALSTPTGVVTNALFRASILNGVAAATIFTSLQESDQAPLNTSAGLADLGTSAAGSAVVSSGSFARLTDTLSQIGVRSTGTGDSYSIYTYGWIDPLGQ